MALLQSPADGHWLGLTCHVLALNELMLGRFDAALEAALRVVAIGEATEDLRIRGIGAWVAGWVHATRGDSALGIEWSRRAVELAADPVTEALAARALGHAHLAAGDNAQAVAWLERAAQHVDRTAFRQSRGLFLAVLADAYRAGTDPRARETAVAALDAAAAVGFEAAVGTAHRVHGRIDLDAGNAGGAARSLDAALATFEAIGAEFEAARTLLDLAEAAAANGDRSRAGRHLLAARQTFRALGAPRYVEHVGALASRLAMSLALLESGSASPTAGGAAGLRDP